MAQIFGVPAFPVDTHIHRLAQRWGLTNGKNVVQISDAPELEKFTMPRMSPNNDDDVDVVGSFF